MNYEIISSRSSGDTPGRIGDDGDTRIYLDDSRSESVKTFQFSPVSALVNRTPAKKELKLSRRLYGFFVQEEGEDARVAFVNEGRLVHYFLPMRLFKEGAITVENQPFELDEFEASVDGVAMKGYRARATARPQDSYREAISLDARSGENLAYLLAAEKDVRD